MFPDRKFRPSPNDDDEWIDDQGIRYDQMGNPAMIPHWNQQRQQFFNQIDRHLAKADRTVIDLTNFPQPIRDEVGDYVVNFPESDFDRVIPIGF